MNHMGQKTTHGQDAGWWWFGGGGGALKRVTFYDRKVGVLVVHILKEV